MDNTIDRVGSDCAAIEFEYVMESVGIARTRNIEYFLYLYVRMRTSSNDPVVNQLVIIECK